MKTIYRLLFSLLLVFSVLPAHGENKKIDSLKQVVATSKNDTLHVKALNSLADAFMAKNKDSARHYAFKALTLSKQLNYLKGIALAYNSIGGSYHLYEKTDSADHYYKLAINYCDSCGMYKQEAKTLRSLGNIYYNHIKYFTALKYWGESMDIWKKLKDTDRIAIMYNEFAIVYDEMGMSGKSMENYMLSNKFAKIAHDTGCELTAFSNIINIDIGNGNFDDALKLNNELLSRAIAVKKTRYVIMAYEHIADVANNLKDYRKAYTYARKMDSALNADPGTMTPVDVSNWKWNVASTLGEALYNLDSVKEALNVYLSYRKATADNPTGFTNTEEVAVNTSYPIGKAYYKLGKIDSAKRNLISSFNIGIRQNVPTLVVESSDLLYQIYKQQKDNVNALYYLEKRAQYNDTIQKNGNQEKLTQLKFQNEIEQNDMQIKLLNEQTNTQAAQLSRQRLVNYAISIGLLLLGALAFFIYRNYRQKQKANLLLEEKNKIIEEKNKDITDSINYARRIQKAMTAPRELKYKMFPDAFIFINPRDIVSGDFEWFTEKNGKRLIAAVDCTGHGVPGAFMSMIGNAFLNEIVNERGITKPSEILTELNNLVIKNLKQTGADGESRDGMDISLLSFNADNTTAEWAGAYNPLLLIRDGQAIEYNADKRPIGYFMGKEGVFMNHTIQLQKKDALYIFSDGFADQFGGPNGKKFKYKKFVELLISFQHEPMPKQEEILLQAFNDWKGNLEQVDDILIIGIRV